MKLNDYIRARGLIAGHVAKKCGVSRQQLDQYDERHTMNLGTAERIAQAMTALGAPTTVADISAAIMTLKS